MCLIKRDTTVAELLARDALLTSEFLYSYFNKAVAVSISLSCPSLFSYPYCTTRRSYHIHYTLLNTENVTVLVNQ
jgi:hypothetical protein